jgi:hypothetical protein
VFAGLACPIWTHLGGHLDQRYSRRLPCEECGQEADEMARSVDWVAYRVDLDDDPDPPGVVVYCPECAAREFDETERA